MIVFLALFSISFADNTKYHAEKNELIIGPCLHNNSIEINYVEVNNYLIGKTCDWVFWDELGNDLQEQLLVITSAARPHGSESSLHYRGDAIDFYKDYAGLVGICAVLTEYKRQYLSLKEFLVITKSTNKHGLGLYPYRLILHFDNRGFKARWGFDKDGNQISIELAETLLDERIEKECS